MDTDSLTYLLRGGHYNMKERVQRGIWPHPPLKLDDVAEHLAQLLDVEQWFPYNPIASVPSGLPTECAFLRRIGNHEYVYFGQRSVAGAPKRVAESWAHSFDNSLDAARYYLKWALQLPGDLDSWKVV